MARKTSKKSDEFKQYLGEKVTVYFKSPLLITTDAEGNPGMLPYIDGYVIDATDDYIRMGDTPDEFTVSVDLNEIVMIKLNNDSEVQEILKHLVNKNDEDVH